MSESEGRLSDTSDLTKTNSTSIGAIRDTSPPSDGSSPPTSANSRPFELLKNKEASSQLKNALPPLNPNASFQTLLDSTSKPLTVPPPPGKHATLPAPPAPPPLMPYPGPSLGLGPKMPSFANAISPSLTMPVKPTHPSQRLIVEADGVMLGKDKVVKRKAEEMDDVKSNEEHIARPPNSFMIFAKMYRPVVQQIHPSVDNKYVSKLLGNKWKSLDPEQKRQFEAAAELAAAAHKKAFPDWKFKRAPAGTKRIPKPRIDSRIQHKFVGNTRMSAPIPIPQMASPTLTPVESVLGQPPPFLAQHKIVPIPALVKPTTVQERPFESMYDTFRTPPRFHAVFSNASLPDANWIDDTGSFPGFSPNKEDFSLNFSKSPSLEITPPKLDMFTANPEQEADLNMKRASLSFLEHRRQMLERAKVTGVPLAPSPEVVLTLQRNALLRSQAFQHPPPSYKASKGVSHDRGHRRRTPPPSFDEAMRWQKDNPQFNHRVVTSLA